MVYTSLMKPEELKKWRSDNGYSQGELAEILGVAIQTISRWERGTREITSFLHLALKAIQEGRRQKLLQERNEKKGGKHGA
jgi:transcriptional regulator with XRE-family HTH domain